MHPKTQPPRRCRACIAHRPGAFLWPQSINSNEPWSHMSARHVRSQLPWRWQGGQSGTAHHLGRNPARPWSSQGRLALKTALLSSTLSQFKQAIDFLSEGLISAGNWPTARRAPAETSETHRRGCSELAAQSQIAPYSVVHCVALHLYGPYRVRKH